MKKVNINLVCPDCGNENAEYAKQVASNAEEPCYECDQCEYTMEQQLREEASIGII